MVWKFAEEDEEHLSSALPIDEVTESRKQPWLLYVLDVNTMNFCSFAVCETEIEVGSREERLLIAVPNIMSSEAVSPLFLSA